MLSEPIIDDALDSLLATKLQVPPIRPALVPRQRLIDRLQDGLRQKVTLISAPAGFGKTTLLSEWASQLESPLAWLSLDDTDNDPSRFLTYLIAGIRRSSPDFADIGRQALALLTSPQMVRLEPVVTMLLNELSAASDRLVVLLDDYHFIDSQAIHEGVGYFMEYLPAHIHLVVSTRTEPPIPLARLRARGLLNELSSVDLRFSTDEMDLFLAVVMGLDLSPYDIARLEQRTEGWIAALQLTALSLRRHDDPAAFIERLAGVDRYILDYMAEEIVQKLDRPIQLFLLRTSIVDRLTASLCSALTGDGNAQLILEALEADNLLIVPLDGERRYYRYHQLFREFLLDRYALQFSEEVPELHRRAADWYRVAGQSEQAIRHFLAAGEHERAAAIMESIVRQTLIRGEVATILGWIDALPEQVRKSRPRLYLAYAWATIINDSSGWRLIQPMVDAITDSLVADDLTLLQSLNRSDLSSSDRKALCELAQLKAFIVRNAGDLPGAVELFEAALRFADKDDYWLRAISAGGLGSLHARLGDARAAERAFAEAYDAGRRSQADYAITAASTILARMLAWQGELRRAAVIYEQVIGSFAGQADEAIPFSGQAMVGLAEIHYEWNRLGTALDDVNRGLDMGRQVNDYDAIADGYVILARISFATGNIEEAYQALETLEQIALEVDFSMWLVAARAWRSRFYLVQGKEGEVMDWLRDRKLTLDGPPEYSGPGQLEYLTYARLLLNTGKASLALPILRRLLPWAHEGSRGSDVLELSALEALCLQAMGRREEAVMTLVQALPMAEAGGIKRLFLDLGPAMAVLLRSARAKGHYPSYTGELLTDFGDDLAADLVIEPLSERELEVLRLVTEGLTNAQIAEELIIAVSTVKTHINRIYGKLGVKTRAQAIARARELRLLY